MIHDFQTLVCRGMLPERLEPTFWETSVEEHEVPGGHQVAIINTPEDLRDARLVCSAWREEVNRFLVEQVNLISREILSSAVRDGLELCNVDQYRDPHALPDETTIVYSIFLGKQEVLAVFMMRRRVDGDASLSAHELIVQCGTQPMPDPDGSHISPEKVVPLPKLCWISAADFSPEQMQEHEDWHHALAEELEDWLIVQIEALRAAAPLRLLFAQLCAQ